MEADSVKYSVGSASDLAILGTGTTAVTTAGTNTIVHKDGQQAVKTKFEIELGNVSFTSAGVTNGTFTLNVKGTATTAITAAVASGTSAARWNLRLERGCN